MYILSPHFMSLELWGKDGSLSRLWKNIDFFPASSVFTERCYFGK